jgi:hypothetical protein
MEQLLLSPEDVLRAIGFDAGDLRFYKKMKEDGLPVVDFYGVEMVTPADLETWLKDRTCRSSN